MFRFRVTGFICSYDRETQSHSIANFKQINSHNLFFNSNVLACEINCQKVAYSQTEKIYIDNCIIQNYNMISRGLQEKIIATLFF